jgi:SAM-dependent methyltransferase
MSKRDRMAARLHAFLVGSVYANHNHSRNVRRAIDSVVAPLARNNEWGLDAGAGAKRLHPRLIAIDLTRSPALDCVASAEHLPFAAESLSLVVSQEVVEHTADPWKAIREAARVLKPGGKLYLQAPFVIGYHPCPRDYWRFTADGLRQLIERAGLHIERIETSIGAGSGMYRIAVEFCAVLAAAFWPRFYLPVKGLAAICFRPICLADRIAAASPAAHRIPGGYFAISVKKTCVS